ncbi:unnamed protein product [Laminaria digitata]
MTPAATAAAGGRSTSVLHATPRNRTGTATPGDVVPNSVVAVRRPTSTDARKAATLRRDGGYKARRKHQRVHYSSRTPRSGRPRCGRNQEQWRYLAWWSVCAADVDKRLIRAPILNTHTQHTTHTNINTTTHTHVPSVTGCAIW